MFCATFSKGRWQPSCSAKLQKKNKQEMLQYVTNAPEGPL